jgi:hypothetical protein
MLGLPGCLDTAHDGNGRLLCAHIFLSCIRTDHLPWLKAICGRFCGHGDSVWKGASLDSPVTGALLSSGIRIWILLYTLLCVLEILYSSAPAVHSDCFNESVDHDVSNGPFSGGGIIARFNKVNMTPEGSTQLRTTDCY